MAPNLFSMDNSNEEATQNSSAKKASKKQSKIQEPKPLKIENIRKSCNDYFHGDSLAADVWINKYALRNGDDVLELTPDDMHRRMAREFARIETKYENPMSENEIFALFKDFKYIIPQGSPMFGIGNNHQIVSLSNCFVIGNDGDSDSYGGIMKLDEEQVQLMKRRGGVGHDMSFIRPKHSPVKNSALTSTGIVPFMERYSNTTKEVAQGGRRGALMLSISIKHPDAEDFIDAKMETDKITGANVSVRIDDEFMRSVEEDKEYVQTFPTEGKAKFTKSINAKKLWEKIIHNAWQSAEPGILFWDTIIRESVPDCYKEFGFKTISTNPCGEIPLCAYDSCRLLAINLYSYVDNPFTSEAKFNFEKFADHVHKGQRLMDDLIDLELEKIDQILKKIEHDPENEDIKRVEKNLWLNIKLKCMEGRRTGFGVTAEGDMIAAMGLKYATDEAIDFSTNIHKHLALEAYRSSVTMAKERGSFAIYDSKLEKNNPFIQRIKKEDELLYKDMLKYGRRNIALLTIAPTGSVSILTQTSSGIEPVFMVAYKRRRKVNGNDKESKVSFTDEQGIKWEEYNVLHPKFLDWAKIQGYDAEEIIHNYTDSQINDLIKQSPYYMATANNIDWVNKVKMQGSIQKWVDHSISVTVNIPKETSEKVVSEIYMTAWRCGCKGMTIYRDGSRNGILVSKDTKENAFREYKAPKRPKRLEADILRFMNDKEKWIAVVGLYEDHPYEIFSGKADNLNIPSYVDKGYIIREKNGLEHARYDLEYTDMDGYKVHIEGISRMFKKEYWNYAKLISGVLRQGMATQNVISLISKLTLDSDSINTWKNGIERALKRYVKDGTRVEGEKCPQCGEELVYANGCKQCPSCGWSKCE